MSAPQISFCEQHKPERAQDGWRHPHWWIKADIPAMRCCKCDEQAQWVVIDLSERTLTNKVSGKQTVSNG